MMSLSPCALCGNTLMDTSNADGLFPAGRGPNDGYIARCGNPACGMEVIGDTKADAIRRWNRRPMVHARRNAEIVERFMEGAMVSELANDYALSVSRIREVLHLAGRRAGFPRFFDMRDLRDALKRHRDTK